MKFNPQPGDKIICNNGEEFICCTQTFLNENDLAATYLMAEDKIFAYREADNQCYHKYDWMCWDDKGETNEEEWDIREVIPQSAESSADKEEEVKEEPRYTVEEVFYAIKEHCGKYDSPLGCEFEIKNLLKRFDEDPKYKEYIRLKAIYE